MRRLLFSLLCSALLAGPISAQAPVASQDTLAYTTSSVRLREKPFPTARALALLPQGTAVRLYGCSQGWCSVAVSQLDAAPALGAAVEPDGGEIGRAHV